MSCSKYLSLQQTCFNLNILPMYTSCSKYQVTFVCLVRFVPTVSYQDGDGTTADTRIDIDDRDNLIHSSVHENKVRCFDYQHYRYIWDPQHGVFKELE